MKDQTNNTTDDYIAGFPKDLQKTLKKIRQTIKRAAPEATEAIKYQIPTFVTPSGNLVHFAAYKTHIGFYPSPSAIEKFKEEFAAYKTSKGAVQFPLDSDIPFDLIKRVVEYRVLEANETKDRATRKKRS
jgi:uncharacterized protein YdhG (YjbR/CyaY superfamily)